MHSQPSSVHGTGDMGGGADSKFLPKTRSHRTTTPSLAQLSSFCTWVAPDASAPPVPPVVWGLLASVLSSWEVRVAPGAG